MMKKYVFLLLLTVPMLSACQEIGKGGRMAEENTKKSLKDTQNALERVFTYYPEKEEYRPIPYSFCYRVMQDITCYDRPIPEARARLVAWQGRDGTYVSSTEKIPSAKSSVQQPSKKVAAKVAAAPETIAKKEEKKEVEKTEKAEVKPLEPVFVKNPPAVKEEKIKIKVTEPSSSAMY